MCFKCSKSYGNVRCFQDESLNIPLRYSTKAKFTKYQYEFTKVQIIQIKQNFCYNKQAFNSLHKGWRLLSVVELAPDGDTLKITPFDLLYGRTITGTLYGGKTQLEVRRL